MRHIYLLFAVIFFSFNLVEAQNGKIRGTVFDEGTGEPMFSVTVVIDGTTNGTVTDFDGKFEISATTGIYDLKVSFISYKTITITGVEVKSGDVTVIDQIALMEDVAQLEDVVITAEAIRSTETALLSVKKKSPNMMDGISAASFRKIGDSDAAAASKRITGVSIEGGKYVYVRGLGDRYTKTMLNSLDVPGLDPDKNTLQMDIFPTNVLNNIVVSKTFTADQPADFTGGMVNIETKDIPDEKTMSLQGSLGFNPAMHFNSDYITYDGSSTDFLGWDDGQRELHISDGEVLDNVQQLSNLDLVNEQIQGFNPTLSTIRKNSFMDFNLGWSMANQKDLSIGTLGYSVALTYKNSTKYYEDIQYSRYERVSGNPDQYELNPIEVRKGDKGSNNVLLGGLLGFSLKRPNSKYTLNVLRLQNGETRAGLFTYDADDNGSDFFGVQSNLEYSQREMTNIMLAGNHYMNGGTWELKWRIAPTISSIEDPDIRFTRYRTDENFTGFNFDGAETGAPRRIWRDLSEVNLSSRVDLLRDYEIFNEGAKLKFGLSNTYKSREFTIRTFEFTVNSDDEYSGDFDEIIYADRLVSSTNLDGNRYSANFVPDNGNYYDASTNVMAAYVSNEFSPISSLKLVVGLRLENYNQVYTGYDADRGFEINSENVLSETNLFPSLNSIYSLSENQNIRASYTRTVARYSFKEASYAAIEDPLTGRTFVGSLGAVEGENWFGAQDMSSTLIDNYDLRWELFQQRGQLVSISAFYKNFSDPIEIVQSSVSDNTFQARNVGDASVYGIELEVRQSLGFFSSVLDNFLISGNTTLLESEVSMSDAEYGARLENARTGETISSKRQLQGQAPYIVNVGLAYDNQGIEVGVYYNVQGATLTYTGGTNIPDVYSVPFQSLNFTSNYTFGELENMRLSFKVDNILNSKRELEFQNYQAQSQLFESISPGTKFTLGFRYSFN